MTTEIASALVGALSVLIPAVGGAYAARLRRRSERETSASDTLAKVGSAWQDVISSMRDEMTRQRTQLTELATRLDELEAEVRAWEQWADEVRLWSRSLPDGLGASLPDPPHTM